METKGKITNITGKIIYGRSEVGKRSERGVIEFLRVKNSLSRLPAKRRVLQKTFI